MNSGFNLSSSPPSGGTQTGHGTPSTLATFMSPLPNNGSSENEADVEKFDLSAITREIGNIAPLHERRNIFVRPVKTSHVSDSGTEPQALAAVSSNTQLSINAQVFTPLTSGFPIANSRDHAVAPTNSPNPGIIGSRPSTAARNGMAYNVGIFTTEEQISTRAFIVSGFELTGQEAYQVIGRTYRNFHSLANINASRMGDGVFLVEFHDHAEAKQALETTFAIFDFPVQCYWLLPKEVAGASGNLTDTVSNHKGEHIVNLINVGARLSQVSAHAVFELCASVGLVKAFRTLRKIGNASMSFRVEWSDSRTDVTSLSAAALGGYRLTVTPYTPDIVQTSINGFGRPSHTINSDLHTRNIMSFLHPSTPSRGLIGTAHNVVDIAKICSGQDVRTTIMLRNIPNRVDQPSLKTLLDQTSRGKYDFMYLRIDFANNCNVGYAFINFVDPMDIVPFVTERAGKKWNLFQSDKVAEVSYATIQGRDCLIQKFRNSSVMLEQRTFRPKLYKTGNGPEAGEEEDFPSADNVAKLKRSCDNAEHVGLYTLTSRGFPGVFRPVQGPIIAPPQNQRSGGHYIEPAQDRRAIEASRAFAQLDQDVQEAAQYPFPSPADQTDFSLRLYAPREGHAYRERQRRQFSQFDRGTPLAQSEFASISDRFVSPHSTTFPAPMCNLVGTYNPRIPLRCSPANSNNLVTYDPSRVLRPTQPRIPNAPHGLTDYLAQSFQSLKL